MKTSKLKTMSRIGFWHVLANLNNKSRYGGLNLESEKAFFGEFKKPIPNSINWPAKSDFKVNKDIVQEIPVFESYSTRFNNHKGHYQYPITPGLNWFVFCVYHFLFWINSKSFVTKPYGHRIETYRQNLSRSVQIPSQPKFSPMNDKISSLRNYFIDLWKSILLDISPVTNKSNKYEYRFIFTKWGVHSFRLLHVERVTGRWVSTNSTGH